MIWEISGLEVKIDDDDYERLSLYNYFVNRPKSKKHGLYYFIREKYENGKRTGTQLHRDVMGCVLYDGKIVDHINGDTLDCRKSNLRLCNRAGNARNAKTRKDNKSGIKGVYWVKNENKWKSQIRVLGKPISLGTFSDIKEAEKAYQEASKKYHGDFGNIG